MAARIFQDCVVDSEPRRRDGELRISIEPFQPVRRKEFLRVPIENFASAADPEGTRIEIGYSADTGFFSQDNVPETFHTFANGGDGTNYSDNDSPSAHQATLFSSTTTYALIRRQ